MFKLIKGDGAILDIGANIGVMTAHLAKQFPQNQVYSFEPIPVNLITLNKLIKFFKLNNVAVIQKALSDSDGTVEMIMPKMGSALKHGLSHIKNKQDINKPGETYSVEKITLDSLIETGKVDTPVIGIKIDVEGHELSVFKGAVNALKDQKPIVYCELWPGEQREETFRFLAALNYKPFVYINGNFKLFDKLIHKKQNFYFLQESII